MHTLVSYYSCASEAVCTYLFSIAYMISSLKGGCGAIFFVGILTPNET